MRIPDLPTSTVLRIRSDCGPCNCKPISKAKDRRQKWKKQQRPVNVIIWAMKVLGNGTQGVRIDKIRTLIRKHFHLPCKKKDIDRRIEMTVMLAVDFGILEKCNSLFFLKCPESNRSLSISSHSNVKI